MLQVRLLGDLVVERDGRAVPLPGRRASRALLAWLVTHPGVHARSALAARFWPDVLEASARSSLRTALADLRRSLGAAATGVLVTSRDHVGLRPGPEVSADLWEFDRLVIEGRLDEALALNRGEMLADLDQGWVLEAREEHTRRLAAILERLASEAEAGGDLHDAVRRSRDRAALEPLSEEAQRSLIRRLTLAGDRPAALLAYRRLAERLRHELGVAPSRETRELVTSVRLGRLRASADRGPPAPQTSWTSDATPFVGRAAELRRLEGLFASMPGRGPQLAVLVGEPGIGKTRLGRELARRLAAGGATVLYGRCDEDGLPPYQPFAEALTRYFRAPASGTVDVQIERFGSELRQLVLDLPALVDVRPGPPGDERHRLFEAVTGLLLEVARTTPTLLVLDDLQWADGATLALLRHLLRTAQTASLLVLVTYRAAEVSHGHPLARTLADLRSDLVPERMVLSGLTEDEVAELAAAAAGKRAPDALSRAICEHTEGNPFFVLEVVRDLLAADGLGTPRPRPLQVPEGVREVIGRSLAALPDPLGRLLTLAAVIGRDFDSAVLGALSGTPADVLAEQLELLSAAQAIEEQPGRPGRFRFVHAFVRDMLYEEMTAGRRILLRRRIAEILERREQAAPDAGPAERADHLV